MMARRILLALLSVLLRFGSDCGPSRAADMFKYPIDDIVVNVNFLPIVGLITQFEGSSFAFKYVDNGMVCSSPYVSVDLNSAKISWDTELDVQTGAYNTAISPKIGVHMEVSQCTLGTFKTDIVCKADVLFSSLGGDILVPTTCEFHNGNIFDVVFSKTFTTRIPALLPSHVPIQLVDPPATGDLKVSFAFTEFKDGNWIPLPAPLNRKRDWPLDVTAMIGGFFAIQSGPPSTYTLLGHNLVLGGTITHPRIWGTAGIGLLAAAYTTPSSFQSALDPLVFIHIRQTLIAPPAVTSPQDPRYGLIGGLFPMKVSAVYEPSNSISLGIEVDVSAVTFKIHDKGGTPDFEASMDVGPVKITDLKTGAPLVGNVQSPSIALGMPTIDRQGRVRFDVKSLNLTIKTELNSTGLEVKLGDLLKSVINDNLPNLTELTPSFTVAVPQCFPAGNTRVQSEIPCTDEYHGQTIGYAARTTQQKSKTLEIDLSKTVISAHEGELEIDFLK